MRKSFRIAELLLEGYKCSHILMKLALEARGTDNPELVRAMSGLALGMGQGFNCGCLTGGCCVLGLCAGGINEDQPPRENFDAILEEFAGWFDCAMTEKYGGINCADIMKFDLTLKQQRCPALILEAWEKAGEILAKYEADVTQPPQNAV